MGSARDHALVPASRWGEQVQPSPAPGTSDLRYCDLDLLIA